MPAIGWWGSGRHRVGGRGSAAAILPRDQRAGPGKVRLADGVDGAEPAAALVEAEGVGLLLLPLLLGGWGLGSWMER